tara:strand:- start:83 stop:262 length:180 start_codon:yes stop_codon:yes gene_type:complete
MSKPKININEFTKDIDNLFKLLNTMNEVNLENKEELLEFEKKAKKIKEDIEKHSKDLDI